MLDPAGGPAGLLERWGRLAGTGPDSMRAGRALLARWDEPHRAYHTVVHLGAVLAHLDLLAADGVAVGVAVELAAWWHDAVYDVRRQDNEPRSAELATMTLVSIGLAANTVAEVARLVLLTDGHRVEPEDEAGAALCDADLGVLGSPPPAYSAYAAAVRREYGHLDDDAFCRGRRAVVADLLGRPALYATGGGRRRWEGAARANLSAELASLQGR
jgi:predicted metal-dependent HD superfamily phosphohydrolase